jgi:DNA helicase-2/ATP-dependent DNA helicase PcrA
MVVVTQGAGLAAYIGQVLPALGLPGVRVVTFDEWAECELRKAIPWIHATLTDDVVPAVTRVKSHPALLHELERKAAARVGKRGSRAAVELWAELLTDRNLLLSLLRNDPEMPVAEADILEAHRIMVTRVQAIVSLDPRDRPSEKKPVPRRRRGRDDGEDLAAAGAWTTMELSENPRGKSVDSDLPEGVRRFESERDEVDDDENVRGEIGIDGQRTEDDQPLLDADDLAMLVRANQLVRPVESPLAHLFVDEAQDLSPMKLAALIGQTRSGATRRLPSLTLAGDTAQKLFLDNGFGDWRAVLSHLGLDLDLTRFGGHPRSGKWA